VIDKLLDVTLKMDENGIARPSMLPLTPEAKARWVQFYNEFAGETAAPVDAADMMSRAFALRLDMQSSPMEDQL
jgi:hypothetical protein